MQGLNFVLPIYVERARNGNLFFRLSPGSRKRIPLPSDPTRAEFDRAYHAALVDAGENNDLDDWSELEAFHAAQKAQRRGTAKTSSTAMSRLPKGWIPEKGTARAKKTRAAREHEPVTVERIERALMLCARLVGYACFTLVPWPVIWRVLG